MSSPDSPPDIGSLSFRELCESETVEPQQLIDCLAEYALNGWSISGSAVVELAQRTNLTPADLQTLDLLSYKGMERQIGGGMFSSSEPTRQREAREYELVAQYTKGELEQLARSD